ncbi:MAG: hypothetical protein KDA44_03760 [Planctomycetales bacterium]|nr:hypothetical protein [Planctomycetales bacterium]
MTPNPYGWLCLAPPIAAIALAIVTRRAVASLLAGIFVGALITSGYHPFTAIHDFFEVHMWPTFVESDRLRVFSFTLLMGAMIGVITAGGGMQGFVHLLTPFARTRRGGQLVTWVMGLAIFFDDYANTMLLGNTMQPVTDRLRVSREKLAYLVDSTAAPVAGISILSTWVAVELAYLQEGIDTLGGVNATAFDLFVASIPYRFYVLLSLVLIPLLVLTGRDFGPMLAAERRALRDGSDTHAGHARPSRDPGGNTPRRPRAINAVLPIVVTLGVVVTLLYQTGGQKLAARAAAIAETASVGKIAATTVLVSGNSPIAAAVLGAVDISPSQQPDPALRDVFGNADSTFALQYGALTGLLLAAVLCWGQRLLTADQIFVAAGQGARVVLPAIAILWCAAALSRMTGAKSVDGQPSVVNGVETYEFRDHRLYTGDFLSHLLTAAETKDGAHSDALPLSAKLLPTLVFILAAIVSFCTGTSFGTMGMLTPMVVTLAAAMLQTTGHNVDGSHPLLLAAVGSVLAGAVFGDHCSPISDTTILSSQSSGCDHIAHVLTQMPYALTTAAVAIVLGTLPVGFGAPVGVVLVAQVAGLASVVFFVGRPLATADEAPAA